MIVVFDVTYVSVDISEYPTFYKFDVPIPVSIRVSVLIGAGWKKGFIQTQIFSAAQLC